MDRLDGFWREVFLRNGDVYESVHSAERLGSFWLPGSPRSRAGQRICPGHSKRTQVAYHSLEAAVYRGCDVNSEDRIQPHRGRDYQSLAESHHRRHATRREKQIHIYRVRCLQVRLSTGRVGFARTGKAAASTGDEAIET